MSTFNNNERACVIGAGSIGLFLQYLLQKSVPATLLGRQKSVSALSEKRLAISGAVASECQVNTAVLDESTSFTEFSTIFIATKAHEVNAILEQLKRRIKPATAIVLCQNGIGLFDAAEKVLGEVPVFRLSCWMGIQRKDLNHIHVAGIHKFDLSGLPQYADVLRNWQEILIDAGVTTTISCNPVYSEWQKALWNITVNGLCSIANRNNGAILEYPELRCAAELILSEAVKVAALEGIELTEQDQQAVFLSLEKTAGNINATLQDLRAGRHPELEYFNGAVTRIAQKHDQIAPLNETIWNLVSFLEKTQQLKES